LEEEDLIGGELKHEQEVVFRTDVASAGLCSGTVSGEEDLLFLNMFHSF